MASGDYFIDAHCHLFNVDDVPLYATLTTALPSRGLLVLGTLLRSAGKELAKRKPMVQFFEKSRWQNLAELSTTIASVRKQTKKTKTILTPLVMNFDKLPDSHECCQEQTEALIATIQGPPPACAAGRGLTVDKATRVFPFFGVDLSRFDQGAADKTLDKLTAFFGGIKRKPGPEQLTNGDIIGIKLYPTIDRGPSPSNQAWTKRREFFAVCEVRKTPITAHCQAGSYHGYKMKKDEVLASAGPENWKKVLGAYSDLRLNLAHFGGDESVKRMMQWRLLQPQMKTQFKKEWVWGVIELLKLFPNTYADISAFAFEDKEAFKAFQQLLVLDELGEWDKAFSQPGPLPKLREKLLWGSDIPMVPIAYDDMFRRFREALDLKKCLPIKEANRLLAGVGVTLPTPASLLESLVSVNPHKFLFT